MNGSGRNWSGGSRSHGLGRRAGRGRFRRCRGSRFGRLHGLGRSCVSWRGMSWRGMGRSSVGRRRRVRYRRSHRRHRRSRVFASRGVSHDGPSRDRDGWRMQRTRSSSDASGKGRPDRRALGHRRSRRSGDRGGCRGFMSNLFHRQRSRGGLRRNRNRRSRLECGRLGRGGIDLGHPGRSMLRGEHRFDVVAARSRGVANEAIPNLESHVFIDRTGMSLLFGDAIFGKQVDDRTWLDFQLASELIDANLLHTNDAAQNTGLAHITPCSAPPLSAAGLRFYRKTRGLYRIRFIS